MKIQLGHMERIAASGVAWRFETEMREARARRDRDMLQIFVEHGIHHLPDDYALMISKEGYVTHISFGEEEPVQDA